MHQIECNNLVVKYENELALKDVGFHVNQGDYLAIIGENGSGKTTLIKAILGLIKTDGGKILFDKSVKKQIGYVPQKNLIQKNFPASVMEVVLSGFVSKDKLIPFYSAKEKEQALKNMKCINIENLKNRSFQNLSGGQQQRVLLARALNSTENIIFMDEPVANLDPVATKEFYDSVNHLNKEHKVTIITTTHDIKTIVKHANKILHLDKKVLFFGTTDEYLKTDLSKIMMGSDHYDIH
jgi:zinc transport system ATP-binding protein